MTQLKPSPRRRWYQLELSDIGWLVFGLSLLLIMISGAWYSSDGSDSDQSVQMVTIDNVADVNQILDDPNCIVLLYASWNVNCEVARRYLEQYVAEWNADQILHGVTVYVVDHTDDRDLARWVDEFVETESELRLAGTRGSAIVLWTREGEIVLYDVSLFNWQTADVTKQTEQAFPPRKKNWWPF